jgi:hypothetical protein
VLAADEPNLLTDFVRHPLGRADLEVHDRLLELLGPHDPRRAEIATRRERLLS